MPRAATPQVGVLLRRKRNMRIIVFGTYQADSHPRVRVLIEGLRAAGHSVVEINQPLGLSTADRVAMLNRPWTVPAFGLRMLRLWATLWRRGRAEAKRRRPDAVLVGYLGHFDVHLARRVFRGTPIILDHLIFAAGTAIDRGKKKGLLTGILDLVDRRAMYAADVIVVDTAEHLARVPPPIADRGRVRARQRTRGARRVGGVARGDRAPRGGRDGVAEPRPAQLPPAVALRVAGAKSRRPSGQSAVSGARGGGLRARAVGSSEAM